mgnify:CR=1 FL=1|tara:strand:+ start:114 stop:434 length:321 start_codon:yes stop_codon:yes gene_type:complete
MKQLIKFIIIIFVVVIPLQAKGHDKTTAIVGHVITEIFKGTNIDTVGIMEQEIHSLGHKYAIDMLGVLERYLPSILKGIAADIRVNTIDEKYKCSLLKGTAYECKK